MFVWSYGRYQLQTYHAVHLRYEIRLRQLQSSLQRNAEFHDKHAFNKMGDTIWWRSTCNYWQYFSSKNDEVFIIFFLYLFQRKYFELKSLLSSHFTLIQLKQLKERFYPHMILVKCAVTGREVYKKICSKLISRENITFESRPWCTFFSWQLVVDLSS